MSDRKKYKKICKKYKKELKAIVKCAAPWDYCFIVNFIDVFLHFMQEYYTLGYNVWAEEQNECSEELKNMPTRLETITQVLEAYKAYMNTEDKYYKLVKTNDEGLKYKIEYLIKDKEKNHTAYIKEEQEHWDHFWNLLRDNIRGWWD